MESHQHGGAEQCLFDLCNGLQADGYEVKLLCNGSRGFMERMSSNLHTGVHVKPVFFFSVDELVNKTLRSSLPSPIKTIIRAGLFVFRYLFYIPNTLLFLFHLRGERGNILHIFNGGYPAAFSCHAAALAGKIMGAKKILFTVLNTPFARRVPLLDRALDLLTTGSVDLFLPDAKYLGDGLRNLHGIPQEKVQVVYTAPKRPKLAFTKSETLTLRAKHGIAADDYVICDVAVFELVKGHKELMHAFAKFAALVPNSKLVLLGDGKTKGEMQQLCATLGLQQRVIFLGFCPREVVQQWLAASDLFVCPSIREGLPYSLIEAMFAGKPVVSTDVGGIPELVEHGQNGLLVPPADVDALAAAMLQMQSDKKKASLMAENGRAKMREEFSLSFMVKRTEELYGLKMAPPQ